jgi:hypothetical protein
MAQCGRNKLTESRICAAVGRLRNAFRIFARGLITVAMAAIFSAFASATDITGSVVNRTTGEPSPGDQIVLYRVGSSMHEAARGISDRLGGFTFKSQTGEAFLVAALHEKIWYHSRQGSGDQAFEIAVYDTSTSKPQLSLQSDTIYVEGDSRTVKLTEFFVVDNHIVPPRTIAGDDTFDFALPKDSVLDAVAVQPSNTAPVPTNAFVSRGSGNYSLSYPLRPGKNIVRLVYHLPYSKEMNLEPHPLYPVKTVAIMIPETMRMTENVPGTFSRQGMENGLVVYKADNVTQRKRMRVLVSGEGEIRKRASEPVAIANSAVAFQQEKALPSVPQEAAKRLPLVFLSLMLLAALSIAGWSLWRFH